MEFKEGNREMKAGRTDLLGPLDRGDALVENEGDHAPIHSQKGKTHIFLKR